MTTLASLGAGRTFRKMEHLFSDTRTDNGTRFRGRIVTVGPDRGIPANFTKFLISARAEWKNLRGTMGGGEKQWIP